MTRIVLGSVGVARAARWLASAAMLAAVATGLGPASAASVTSCMAPDAAQVVAGADVIVIGRVVGREGPLVSGYSPHPVAWTVDVDRVLKGEAPRRLFAVADDMVAFEGDSAPAVLALNRLGDELHVNTCAITSPGTPDGDAVIAVAGSAAGQTPSDRRDLPGATPPDIGLTASGALRWGGLLLLTTAAILGVRRLRTVRRRALAVPVP